MKKVEQLSIPKEGFTKACIESMSAKELCESISDGYGLIQAHYKTAVAYSLMLGLLLVELKKKTQHGQYKTMIREMLPTISYVTANRYRKMAVGFLESLQKYHFDTFSEDDILQLPQLPKERQEVILAAIEELTGGQTKTELYFENDICNRPDRAPKKVTEPDDDEDREPTAEELRAIAKADWEPFCDHLLELYEKKNYTLLPKQQRITTAGFLEKLAKEIRETL